jgi:hypothetical protein
MCVLQPHPNCWHVLVVAIQTHVNSYSLWFNRNITGNLKRRDNSKFDVHRAVHRSTISIVKPTRCTNVSSLFYFWNDTLHVSDGLSVHHQEFKTVHTATGICQTDTDLSDKCLFLYVHSRTPDDGRKDRPKHVECHSKNKINLINWCMLSVLLHK